MVKAFVAFAFELSVACATNAKVPARVGVPLTNPALVRLNPSGSVPELRIQLYGATPPVALRIAAYGTEALPAGNVESVVITTPCVTSSLNDRVAVCRGVPPAA